MPVLLHDHINMNKLSVFAIPLFLSTGLLISACGGGGGGGSGDGGGDTSASGGDTSGTATAGTSGDTTGGGDTSGGGGDTAGTGGEPLSGLSHIGKVLPRNSVNPEGTALVSEAGRTQVAAIPQSLAVVYEVVENHGSDAFNPANRPNCSSLGAEYASCSIANLHINDATGTLNDGNWKLYFHSIRRILRVDSDEFSVSLVNGDLNYLEPTADFTGFDGSVKTIAMVTEFNHLAESDFMPRYWLVRNDGAVTLINNTNSDTDESTYSAPINGDNQYAYNGEPVDLATTQSRFVNNTEVQGLVDAMSPADIQSRIVPRPQSISLGSNTVNIGGGFSFSGTDLSPGSVNALQSRQAQFMSVADSVPLSADIDAGMADEQYALSVASGGIELSGGSDQALFYAAQSLLSLVQPGLGTIPTVEVQDAPRFDFRGMHIDVARNFHSVATVKRLLDQMAAYKLNKLHIHLSDDEGWRLQIPSLPELTSVGGRRAFQLDGAGNVTEGGGLMPQLGSGPNADNQGSGFYARAEFIDLLRYATDRHIDVIPEFDMPAHARAAVVSMRARAVNLGDADDLNTRLDDPADTSRYLTIQHYDDGILNPCIPGTYNFIDSVITDVKAMYTEAGASLDVWHMGGDEARNVFTGGGFQDVNAGDKVSWRGETVRSEWDYPWEASPACAQFIQDTPAVASREDLQIYFIKEVAQRVADAGISSLFAYQDIYDNLNANELATTRAGVGYWEMIATATGYNAINGFSNRGFDAIVAVPDFLYFDFPQEIDPAERGYYWATRFTDTRKVFGFAPENLPQNAETSVSREGRGWTATGDTANQGFHGMQGQLWSETVRTPQQFDYMVYPRLLALAERAWSRADWELDYVAGRTYSDSSSLVDKPARTADYASFAAALATKELRKLDAAGVQYRIPVPGATNTAGTLSMNTDLPGLPLEYSSDGVNFTTYTEGVSANGVVAVRARSGDSSRFGRADSLD